MLGIAEHFSCSSVVAYVLAPYVLQSETTASNKCKRCRGVKDWDVSSCRCLATADHAHRILCCTSVLSWSTYVTHFSFGKMYLDIHLVDLDFSQLVFWYVEILVSLGWISSLCASALFLKSAIIFELFRRGAIMSTSSTKSGLDMQSLLFINSLMPGPFSLQISVSFSIAGWRTDLKKRLLKSLFVLFSKQYRIHHSPRQSVRWCVDQSTIFQEAPVLFAMTE